MVLNKKKFEKLLNNLLVDIKSNIHYTHFTILFVYIE